MANDKRHLLIFFKTGGVVRIDDIPSGFVFADMCTSVRAVGYFNNGVLYFPHDAINGMAYVLDETEFTIDPSDGKRTTLQ